MISILKELDRGPGQPSARCRAWLIQVKASTSFRVPTDSQGQTQVQTLHFLITLSFIWTSRRPAQAPGPGINSNKTFQNRSTPLKEEKAPRICSNTRVVCLVARSKTAAFELLTTLTHHLSLSMKTFLLIHHHSSFTKPSATWQAHHRQRQLNFAHRDRNYRQRPASVRFTRKEQIERRTTSFTSLPKLLLPTPKCFPPRPPPSKQK